MNTDARQPGTELSDEEKARAIDAGAAWVDDYLDRYGLMVEGLQRALAKHALGQLLLALGPRYGKIAVSRVLEAIIQSVPQDEKGDHIRRRIHEGDVSLLDDESADFDWLDLSAEIAHLFAFARYGYGRHLDPDKSRAEIEELLIHFRRVVADAGIRAAAGDDADWLADTLAAAEARWAVDHGRAVMPDDLAALAGVKPKTIANLLAARELSTDADGRIPAAEALRYLERREGFVRSNWQYGADQVAAPAREETTVLAEQVFVPVDSDGNAFLPSMARRGRDGVLRYAIGAKSDPDYVEDYWEALDRLARMPTPRWRRPPASGKGGWSLVSAQDGWRRFARADLERMITAMRTR
ncbi:MAG: hypothetical protein IRZ04_19685 [Rhodospirillales bacterium]|nr:hypothetical protein [Rhodospirillales bacterium]